MCKSFLCGIWLITFPRLLQEHGFCLQGFISVGKLFVTNDGESPRFSFRVDFNGFPFGLCKLALFKSCLPRTYCKLCSPAYIDTFLVFNTFIKFLSSDIFLTPLFGVSVSKFPKSKFSEKFGHSNSIVRMFKMASVFQFSFGGTLFAPSFDRKTPAKS